MHKIEIGITTNTCSTYNACECCSKTLHKTSIICRNIDYVTLFVFRSSEILSKCLVKFVI